MNPVHRHLVLGAAIAALLPGPRAFGADSPATADAANIAHCVADSPSPLEQNKCTVIRFYNKALNDKDADAALDYVGPHYVQHNPSAQDDRDGLRRFIEWVRADHPNSRSEIVQAFADGDFVVLNVRMVRFPEKNDRGLAIGEFFRLANGKIVEHWDRIQAIPDKSLNPNAMF